MSKLEGGESCVFNLKRGRTVMLGLRTTGRLKQVILDCVRFVGLRQIRIGPEVAHKRSVFSARTLVGIGAQKMMYLN